MPIMKIRSVPRHPGKGHPTGPAHPPASSPARGRLRVEPTEVRDKADQLGALAPQLGGPLAALSQAQQDQQEAHYILEVDPFAQLVGDRVQRDLLRRYDEVARAAEEDPDRHRALLDQMDAAAAAYTNARQRADDIDDGLRVVGHTNRVLRDELSRAIPLAIAHGSGSIPPGEQASFLSAWNTIQAEIDKQKQKSADARQQSQAETQKWQEQLAQQQRRAQLIDTIADLHAGRPPAPEQAAAAVAGYKEWQKEQESAAARPAPATPTKPDRRRKPRQ